MRSRLYNITVFKLIVFFLLSTAVHSQDEGYKLTGKITGMGTSPVANVSISIEGVNVAPVLTQDDGTYELEVPNGKVWLIVSPVDAYQPQRIYLSNRTKLNIYLTPIDYTSIREEISIFNTNLEKRNIISSYQYYNSEQNDMYPYQTIDEYLQGAISGMQVIKHSGMPGSGASTFIRGMKSINTNNQPLYIVDGMPFETFGIFGSELQGSIYNPLTSLEPFDISSIVVLKDDAATALYGVRGSNGVVLIETLRPTELSTKIDFSFKTGVVSQPERKFTQMDNVQHRTYANELLLTSSELEENFPELYPALFSNSTTDDYDRYRHNTNWQDEIFRDGIMNDVQLKLRGGDEIARYGLSVGFVQSTGILKSTDYERLNIRVVGTFNIFQWLRMYISTYYNTNTSNLVESSLSRQTSPILASLSKSPMMMPYMFDRDGNQLNVLDDVGTFQISNPYSIVENFIGTQRNNHSLNTIRLNGDISNSFKFTSVFGINLNTLDEQVFMPNYGMPFYYDGTAYNVSKSVKNFLYNIYNEHSVSYLPKLNQKHSIQMNLGFRSSTNRHELDYAIAKNSHESDEYKSLQNGVFYLNELGGDVSRWNRLAVFYNANYNYIDKYLLSLSTSLENSTRFGRETDLMEIGNVPFASFYSLGAGWRLSSENFMKNLNWLNEFKLRASYSVSGNDDIGNISGYNYLRIDHYRETSTVVPGNLTDGTLKNETYKQFNAGVDISLWGDRVGLSMNYYDILTEDMLVYEPQNFYSGFAFVPRNNGSVQNKGFEVNFSTRVINGRRFKWDLNLNVTPWQVNEVLDIRNGKLITQIPGGEIMTKTGSSMVEYYGYQYEGVFSTTDEATDAALINDKGIPFKAGDARFADISGPNGVPDNVINDFDKVSIGSPMPEMYGGLQSTITYRRWALDANLYFVTGNELYNYLRFENEKMSDLSNQSAHTLNRWTHEGQITNVPRALWEDPVGNSALSSRWIEDGSFLRVKNVSLSYTVPNKVLVFNNLKAFVTVTNLFTFSNYLGYDPEFSSSFNPLRQGVDYGLMPATRSFMIGLKVGL